MKEIMSFLSEIFMMKDNGKIKVGLSQFKSITPVEKKESKVVKPTTEVKLSDLMRGA